MDPRRASSSRPLRTVTAALVGVSAACGASATIQEQAGDAVIGYIAGDDILSDGDFSDDCVRSTAAGLTDEIAGDVVDDDGCVDLDVDDRNRDDVYDFYNCADERDLARAIADNSRDEIDDDCLELAFDDDGVGDILSSSDGDDADRLGNFDSVTLGECAAIAATTTTPPETTTTTVPPETSTTETPSTTERPATTGAPPSTSDSQAMPGELDETPEVFVAEAEDYLNNAQEVADAVGGDVDTTFCIAPTGIAPGTNFSCFGVADGFGAITFTVEIDAPRSFLVNSFDASPSFDKILFFGFLVEGLAAEDLLVDQICLRGVVDGLPEEDIAIIVAELDAPELPDGVSFDDDALANAILPCLS